MQLASRLMALPSASPVGQQAATLEPQACWMGMATTREVVSDVYQRKDGSGSGGLRMGTLKQLRPMRSSPLLQQAILEPLPHLASLEEESISTFLLPSEAPDWGTAKATAATEAMMRVFKKAIVDDWLVLVERVGKRVWYCWIGLDCWMMRRS